MTPISLDGQRVRVRDWLLEDLESFAHWMRPGQRWQELDGPYYPHAKEDEIPGIVGRITTRVVQGDFPDPRQNLIIASASDNRLIGQVSRYWISQETQWLAAGIVIYDPALWGQGLGYEALGLWAEYLFTRFPQIVRLDLQTWSGNRSMMRLAQKLGFQLEGCFRKARIVNGEYFDSLGYGILRDEWTARFPEGFARSL